MFRSFAQKLKEKFCSLRENQEIDWENVTKMLR